MTAGKFDQAIPIYRELLLADPKNPGEGRAAMRIGLLEICAGAGRGVRKGSVSQVGEDRVGLLVLRGLEHRHIFELAIAKVVVKRVLENPRHEKVHVDVVVAIRRRSAHGIAGPAGAGLLGHFGEFPSPVVAKEPVEIAGRILLERRICRC